MRWLQVRHLKDLLEPCKRTVLESFGSHSAPVDIGLATGVIVCTIEKANTLVRGRPWGCPHISCVVHLSPAADGHAAPCRYRAWHKFFTHTNDGLQSPTSMAVAQASPVAGLGLPASIKCGSIATYSLRNLSTNGTRLELQYQNMTNAENSL